MEERNQHGYKLKKTAFRCSACLANLCSHDSATYHVPGPRDVSGSRLHAGDIVGCLMTTDGEIESMWLISGNNR